MNKHTLSWRKYLELNKLRLLLIKKDMVDILEKSRIVDVLYTLSNKHIRVYLDETKQTYVIYQSVSGEWHMAEITNGIGNAKERYTSEIFHRLVDGHDWGELSD